MGEDPAMSTEHDPACRGVAKCCTSRHPTVHGSQGSSCFVAHERVEVVNVRGLAVVGMAARIRLTSVAA